MIKEAPTSLIISFWCTQNKDQNTNLHYLLSQRTAEGKSVCLGLIGAGTFGTMLLVQARLTTGIQIVAIADLEIQRGGCVPRRTDWPADSVVAAQTSGAINDAAAAGRVTLTEDARTLAKADV